MLNWLNRHSKILFPLALLIVALIGMAALWQSTPFGLGLVNDTAYYMEGAANLLAGRGYVRLSGGGELKPITHFPPLFSLLLVGFGLVGIELLDGARLLITLLFGLSILLVGGSIYKISRSAVFSLFGALLLAFSDVHLGVYSFALSEPLFLTLTLALFLSFTQSFEQQDWRWYLLTGILLSLAYLTRYAGASLLITILLAVILLRLPFQPASWRKRWLARLPYREFLLILGGAFLPILAWSLYNLSASQSGVLSNRLIAWHPPSLKLLFEAFKNLLTWLAPNELISRLPLIGRLLSLLSLILLPGLLPWLVWVIWQRYRRQPPLGSHLVLAFTLALHIPVYLAFLIISLTFFDASTPLNDRILSVIYIPEIILFASSLAWVWKLPIQQVKRLRWAVGTFCALTLFFNLQDGISAMQQLQAQGQGFAHQGWRQSQTIQALRNLPQVTLYSNKPTAIYLLTGRSAYIIPTPNDSVTGLPRPTYPADRDLIQQRVRQGQALLVLFGLRDSPDPDEVALFEDLSAGLPVLADYGDGVIFGIAP